MTGNPLHNLTRAVAGFKDLSTNTTHYQDITSLILTDTALDTFSHSCLPPISRPSQSASSIIIMQHIVLNRAKEVSNTFVFEPNIW